MEIEQFQKLVHNLRNQDNRATANPLFVVQQVRRVHGVDPQFYGSEELGDLWVNNNDSEEQHDTVQAMMEEILEGYDVDPVALYDAIDILDDGDDLEMLDGVISYSRHSFLKIYVPVTVHFTEAAANQYIEQNSHNLADPRVFVESQSRATEWNAVVEALKNGTMTITEEKRP